MRVFLDRDGLEPRRGGVGAAAFPGRGEPKDGPSCGPGVEPGWAKPARRVATLLGMLVHTHLEGLLV